MRRAKKSQKRIAKKAKKARQAKPSSRGTLKRAIRALLPEAIFTGLARHGNTEWSLNVLAVVALFWGISGETTLGERHTLALEIVTHWFPGEFLATSYRGFMNALVRHNAVLVKVVSERLRKRMLELESERGRIAGLTPFVVDGSQVGAPWTKANEEVLGKKGRKPKGAKCRKKETDLRPQLTLTMLWHMNLGLPWAWKHGGLSDGERTQFRELLDQLPQAALVVADAGFVGYLLWQTILSGGRHFLIRVGANVELLQDLVPGLEMAREGERVWLWPDGQRQKGFPPLALRLIRVQKGKQAWYLVTSLLDPLALTETEASKLYTRRWGVEGYFRTLKQTLEKSKMRSYTPQCAGCELDWSLLSLWMVSLLTKQELLSENIGPEHYSPAQARRLIRRELRYLSVGEERLEVSELQSAVKDHYHRTKSKKARHDQRKKHDPAPRAPKLKKASRAQQHAAKALIQTPARAA
jgi:DDE family transposase